jgi:hypothetical protein
MEVDRSGWNAEDSQEQVLVFSCLVTTVTGNCISHLALKSLVAQGFGPQA